VLSRGISINRWQLLGLKQIHWFSANKRVTISECYLNTKFPSFWFFSHSCCQPSSRWWFSICVDGSGNYTWSIPVRANINKQMHPLHKLLQKRSSSRRVRFSVKKAANLRDWDFAQLGSPTIQASMSSLRLIPSRVKLWTPPKSISRSARLISWWQKQLEQYYLQACWRNQVRFSFFELHLASLPVK